LIDSLRGAAALTVMLHHVRTLFASLDAQLAEHAPGLHAVVAFVADRNVEAVLLFFVLSGLSIRLSVERRALTEPGAFTEYLWRRLRRILPLYWLALLVSGLVAVYLAPVPAEALSTSTLLGNLLFLQTAFGVPGQWVMPYAGNAPLWSLSFEMFFYLSFPGLVRSVPSLRARMLTVLGVSAAGYLVGELVPNPLAMFCAASLLWYLGVELGELHLRGRASLPTWAFAVLWLALVPVLGSSRATTFYGAFVALGFFLAGCMLVRAAPRLQSVYSRLRAPLLVPFARVGAFSYALYLLHVPILRGFAATLGQTATSAVLGCSACFAFAYAAERVAAQVPRGLPSRSLARGAQA
jgi:peptidoglycan/LPS O-acetylase OafA/YrhL